MKHALNSYQRGAALLLVLFGLMATSALLVPAATWALSLRGSARTLAEQESTLSVLRAVEPAILDWLTAVAPTLVLPPSAAIPGALVLEQRFAGSPALSLRILGFDQAGMVALGAVRAGSPLSLLLPPRIRQGAQALAELEVPHGLDDLAGRSSGSSDWTVELGERLFTRGLDDQAAFGGLVATHVPGAGELCPWTAPVPLLERAFLLAGRADLGAVLGARAAGKRIDLALGSSGSEVSTTPHLVYQGSFWSFRIDIAVGRTRQAWWVTYQGSLGSWQPVQRVFIDE